MRIFALDLGNRAGFAEGEAGELPSAVLAIDLKRRGQDAETAARNLGCFLRDRMVLGVPDLICVEHFMQPAGQPSDEVTITHLLLHGALLGVAGPYGIRVEAPYTATVTKHFCGQATAAPRITGPKTARQKAEARDAKKRMVLNRAIALRYLPHGTTDFDKADACALFDYAAATFARRAPRALVMFGGMA